MYKEFETKTSYKYLQEVIKHLNEPICILGGWAVFFHVNKNFQKAQNKPYLGSRDIDLGFHLKENMTQSELEQSSLAQTIYILRDKLNFKPLSFRLLKEIHTETEEGTVTTKGSLQTRLDEIKNPYLNGLEGFFILESDLDIEAERALALYKDKDKAEKLFRSIKEGTELRPMRHWSRDAIIGYILIIFLTNFLINLTLLRAKDPVVKNTKLLKKYLRKLTLVIIYPPTGFKFHILANICPEITSILGDFIEKYVDKTLPMRW